MKVRILSPSGDYTFGQSQLNFYSNVPAAPAQVAKTSLELWQGEWYLDLSEGTPYLTGVLGKHSQTMADAVIKNQVLNAQGITGVSNFQSSIDTKTRQYSVQMTVSTIYGPTPLQLSNYVNF